MAVVLRQDTVLIQRRFRTGVGMVYEFPGGKVDANEHYIESAIRELREETGLIVNKPICSELFESETTGKIAFVVFCPNNKKEPIGTDPIRRQQFYWLRSDNIPVGDFHAADRLFIEKYLPVIIANR